MHLAPAAVPSRGADPEPSLPAAPKFLLSVDGSLNNITATLAANYGSRRADAGFDEEKMFTFRADGGRLLSRDIAAENAAAEILISFGFAKRARPPSFTLSGERKILTFFAQMQRALPADWSVTIGEQFGNVTHSISRIRPVFDVQSSGENWFDLDLTLAASSGESFSAHEIHRLLQSGQNHTRLQNGKLAVFDSDLLDELTEALRDCDPIQNRPGHYRIDRMHAGYLASLDGVESKAGALAGWGRVQESLRAIPLGALELALRDYQKTGVYWLEFLRQNGFGGILADEMGLGKTLQALAFLSATKRPDDPPLPALVICPSSLVFNWEREAARWCPGMTTLAYEGPRRSALVERMGAAELVITSYAIARRDAERLRGMEFRAIFLDEAQHIKNPDTQNAKAVFSLRAPARFALTGTPVENSPRDLWSIMHFAMPGYLGSRDDFQERYVGPIGRQDGAAHKRLARRLRPFLLRRRKLQVCAELPEKLELVQWCDLAPEQSAAYQKLLSAARDKIDGETKRNPGQARMIMLTALLRLRQVCCDLRLLDPAKESASGKVAMTFELLDEAIEGGHRVLLFSQFVRMLSLLREELERREISFCYLDGATRDRAAAVDAFQEDSSKAVFLISLKAGGVGLNLTGADTVIHFDPWWNPAVEDQATDRAHRIGQKNVVTSYKLIARGTVEEKILNLQKQKRALVEATIESEEPMMTGLSLDEIRSLLE